MSPIDNNSRVGGPGHDTSYSLLDRVQLNDEQAWITLTELYGPLIYYWSRKAGLSAEDSADTLQDVFCSLHKGMADFKKTKPSGSFRAWLWTITRNRIRDHFRCHGQKAAGRGGTTALLQLMNVPELASLDDSDSAAVISQGLTSRALAMVKQEVQEVTWQAFWRTTVDNVAPVMAAEELGLSTASIYQAKSRVLRRLRDLLGHDSTE